MLLVAVSCVGGDVGTSPTPNIPTLTTVSVSLSASTVNVGQAVVATASGSDRNGSPITLGAITWTTSPVSIASVSSSGVVTGAAPGQVTVIASVGGKQGQSTLSVTVVVTGRIPLTCAGVAGGLVYANDGQYLGRLTNRFESQSILNTFGSYGSEFSSTSMFNSFSQYGSQFSSLSAYNSFTSTPPKLNVSGQLAAYATKNTLKIPRYDPDALRSCAFP